MNTARDQKNGTIFPLVRAGVVGGALVLLGFIGGYLLRDRGVVGMEKPAPGHGALASPAWVRANEDVLQLRAENVALKESLGTAEAGLARANQAAEAMREESRLATEAIRRMEKENAEMVARRAVEAGEFATLRERLAAFEQQEQRGELARAESAGPVVAELRARSERLERENRRLGNRAAELAKAVEQLRIENRITADALARESLRHAPARPAGAAELMANAGRIW